MNTMVQTFKDMGRVKLAAMLGVTTILLAIFIVIALRASAPGMTALYTSLSVEDSGQIVSQLDKAGIPYTLKGEGTQIMVPSDQVLHLRLTLAQQGLPTGGSLVGYEIFDRSEALGTSNFVLNVNMLRALEGELARTIGSFTQVDSARVHLVVPKRELFTRDRQEPTASVALKLRGGELSKTEIGAIQHLVATAVPGLKPSAITIVDSRGRLLAKGAGDEESADLYSSNAQELRIAYENRMKNTVESLIEKSVGVGKVKAQVTADMDFDRVVTNSETYDPEGQVARSIQGVSEKESSSEKDANNNVSVANNLPDSNASGAGSVTSRSTERSDETTNFEISKVVENHVKESGTVNRLSVAVLVDGIYTTDEEGKQTYAPRSENELKQLTALARTAVGYDEKRGDTVEVVNMRFSETTEGIFEESPFDWLKSELQGIIQTLVLGGVALLAILLVIRPMMNRMLEATPGTREAAEKGPAALEGPGLAAARLTDQSGAVDEESLINIDRIEGRVKSSTFRKMGELIDKHPDETLTVMRQWMYTEAS